MQVSVIGNDGSDSGKTLELSDVTYDAKYNEALVHQVVTAYLAGARSGTRAQKNRSAVSGGGAKPFRQKGTGRARAGTIRSPIWRGGGKVFPAETQSFVQKVNRKMYSGSMKSILSELLRQDRMKVVTDFSVDSPKTSLVAAQLKALGVSDALIIVDEPEESLVLAARNIPNVEVSDLSGLNPYSLLRHENVIITSAAATKLEGMYS